MRVLPKPRRLTTAEKCRQKIICRLLTPQMGFGMGMEPKGRPPSSGNLYLQPDGVDQYLQPDGYRYLQPL